MWSKVWAIWITTKVYCHLNDGQLFPLQLQRDVNVVETVCFWVWYSIYSLPDRWNLEKKPCNNQSKADHIIWCCSHHWCCPFSLKYVHRPSRSLDSRPDFFFASGIAEFWDYASTPNIRNYYINKGRRQMCPSSKREEYSIHTISRIRSCIENF